MQRDARHDPVHTSGQAIQHAQGIVLTLRLAEHVVINDDRRICRQYNALVISARRRRFCGSQSEHHRVRCLTGDLLLINVHPGHGVTDAESLQNLRTARRRRSKMQLRCSLSHDGRDAPTASNRLGTFVRQTAPGPGHAAV